MSAVPAGRGPSELANARRARLAPQVLDRLFDDASQFPPGDLSLEAAVASHVRWRDGLHRRWVGRFLLPVRRVAAFAELVAEDAHRFELGLVVPADIPQSAAAQAARLLGTRANVTAIEIPLRAGPAVIAGWRGAFPRAELFLEGSSGDVAAIGRLGARPKLRCGGLAPEAVPSVPMVAKFVVESVARGLPFKATAGLHQPLRHLDADLGVEVHGFLNLWVATRRAQTRAPHREIEEALTRTDLGSLALGEEELQAARTSFTAFGTCSISEPIAALAQLGLLHE
ncbi:MAG TPA: hypothetical protein VIK04_10015 [Solirubrobacteraceae bacterium]